MPANPALFRAMWREGANPVVRPDSPSSIGRLVALDGRLLNAPTRLEPGVFSETPRIARNSRSTARLN